MLERSVWVLPFTVVAEMPFGAEVAGWGTRRRSVLDRLVAASGVVPPLQEVTDAYVELRTWCVHTGHGLGALTPKIRSKPSRSTGRAATSATRNSTLGPNSDHR